ncbi:MAG: hypothetical protein LKK19_00090 [Bacteroidales bacterium]|jgi:REP element-mobilizing transposase RayT|nr:hypothetical protein [Bacteroidales bacterium]MCI2121093.1 hypothetical protein [Bacteroidales bacterium]MCI2144908.1 hypothetical protein [Bacteroidales bacterium]
MKTERSESRPQEGFFGITISSNYQTAIFRAEEERREFLEILFEYAGRYDGKVTDFAELDTHIHIGVYAKTLSKMMGTIIRVFSMKYNARHQKGGRIFRSPFSSFTISSDKQMLDYTYYIMYNPIAAGICSHPKDYRWCSWNYHFRNTNRLIDTTMVDSMFLDMKAFEKGFWQYCDLRSRCRKERGEDNRWKNVSIDNPAGDPPTELGTGYRKGCNIGNTDEQILIYLSKILNEKEVYALTAAEADQYAFRLFRETYATIRQVSTALAMTRDHAHYLYKKLRTEHFPTTME